MRVGTGDDNLFPTLDVSSEVAADVWEEEVKLSSFTLICLPGTGTRMVPSLRSSLPSCSIFIGMGEPAPWLERQSLVGPLVSRLPGFTFVCDWLPACDWLLAFPRKLGLFWWNKLRLLLFPVLNMIFSGSAPTTFRAEMKNLPVTKKHFS